MDLLIFFQLHDSTFVNHASKVKHAIVLKILFLDPSRAISLNELLYPFPTR